MFFIKKLIILLIIAGFVTIISSNNEYVEIPSTSIRMRVIASSNSEIDQSNKKIIKSALEEKLYDLIGTQDSSEKVNQIIESNDSEIQSFIKETMIKNNIDNTFTTSYGYNFFPEKEFKGLVYSAGNYKSYVVTLGNGEGDNWWCVLYPPLCKIDENINDYEYHSLIKDTISKYN